MRPWAIILSAGFSSRMTGFKPLLPLPFDGGDRTPLEALCALYEEAGVSPLVISGHRAEEVETLARRCGAATARNPHPEYGMFSSACRGVAALPEQATHFFIHPVDIPLVRAITIRSLLNAADGDAADHCLWLPTWRDTEGHPPLFTADCGATLLAWRGSDGLRTAAASFERRRVPVPDRTILTDMDTDMAFLRVGLMAKKRHVLNPEEARVLLRLRGVSPAGVAHGEAVGALAAAFARRLAERGLPLDPDVALAGGLLHDLCKKQPRHEEAAGVFFRACGLPRMAWLVSAHRDLELAPDAPVTERELVYLADKYAWGARPVSVRQRFQQKMDAWSHDPEAVAAISARLERALRMEARVARDGDFQPLELALETLGASA